MKKAIAITALLTLTSCAQVLGIREMDAWGFKAKFSTGIGASADVQQYNQVLEKKGMDADLLPENTLNKY